MQISDPSTSILLNKISLIKLELPPIEQTKTSAKPSFSRHNEHLEQLILTGNPCCEYEGYREYVIAVLPQIRELDMKSIDRSERIKALQKYAEAKGDVIRGYRKYLQTREVQKQRRRREGESESSSSSGVRITEVRDDEDERNVGFAGDSGDFFSFFL